MVQAELRTWTNKDGRTVKAHFDKLDGDTARMILLNGKKAAVPLENLSEDDQTWVKARTEPATVPDELRGQGIAAILTRAALDEARRLDWKIIPACSYVETFIKRNPEFTGLLAG